ERSGCWNNGFQQSQAAYRFALPPSRRIDNLGLRLARVPVGKEIVKGQAARVGASRQQIPQKVTDVLKFFVGSWKMEGVIDEPKLPAGREARATGVQTFALVAEGKFLRGCDGDTKGLFETLTLQAWDPEEQAFKGWFFASDGDMTGPAVGTWDANKRLLTWKE